MERWNSLMSNMMNLHKCLWSISFNKAITVSASLHWFKPIASSMLLFAVSKIALLIRSNSFFSGFMGHTVELFLNLSLRYFRVIKLLFSLFVSNRFSTSLFFKICSPSILVYFFILLLAFLYFELWNCLWYSRILFVVLSAKVTVLSVLIDWIFALIFFWKWFLVFINLMFCTNAIRSFSKDMSSFTCLSVFKDLSPYHSIFTPFFSLFAIT